jgi:anti-anti-sigma factor
VSTTSQRLQITADADGVLRLSGELDLEQMDAFVERAMASVDGQREIVFDLSQLTFLDSSGIRAIVGLAGRIPQGVVLRNPRDNVRRVLRIVDLESCPGIRLEQSDRQMSR